MAEESTTPDPVEVVSGLFEAADRGDWDAVLSAYAPYAVLETADGVFDAVSPARMRGFWDEWVDGRITRLITRPDIDEARAIAERLAEERG